MLFGKLFDFNRDGKMHFSERALELGLLEDLLDEEDYGYDESGLFDEEDLDFDDDDLDF